MRVFLDRKLLEFHGKINLSEDYAVDFGEVSYPMSPQEERSWLDWKLDKGIMTQRELLLYFNSDMSSEEIDAKLGEVREEKKVNAESIKPQSTFEKLLNV